jgi:hypothetical protein
MSPKMNLNTENSATLGSRQFILLDFIESFQARHEGQSPTLAQMSEHISMSIYVAFSDLHRLELAGKIERQGRDIMILAEDDVDDDSRLGVLETYTPPADLRSAQLAASRYWTACQMHLAEIERLRQALAKYREYELPKPAQIMIRRQELRINELEEENRHWREAARNAESAWLSYATRRREADRQLLQDVMRWARTR